MAPSRHHCADHNKRVLGLGETLTEKGSNCRDGAQNCMLDGQRLT